jgi:hypothetical protein
MMIWGSPAVAVNREAILPTPTFTQLTDLARLIRPRPSSAWMTGYPSVSFPNSRFGVALGIAKKLWKSGRPSRSNPAIRFKT